MVVPPDHVRIVERLAQNFYICTAHAAQRLALYTMDCDDELQARVAQYATSRALLLDGLPAAGLDRIVPPDGAFYIYADVSRWTDDSLALAAEILAEAGVAVTPGLDFDPDRGRHWLRLSYAGTGADVAEGLARLTAFFRNRPPIR
jgi:aspartate/methionine/tyrosine aminotransferase